jgi:hypothetical protein
MVCKVRPASKFHTVVVCVVSAAVKIRTYDAYTTGVHGHTRHVTAVTRALSALAVHADRSGATATPTYVSM